MTRARAMRDVTEDDMRCAHVVGPEELHHDDGGWHMGRAGHVQHRNPYQHLPLLRSRWPLLPSPLLSSSDMFFLPPSSTSIFSPSCTSSAE